MKRKITSRTHNSTIDPDNPEWTTEDLRRAVPLKGLPKEIQQAIAARKRGSQKAPKKVAVSIRLSPDVVEAFRASGAGWQGRIDKILREHIR